MEWRRNRISCLARNQVEKYFSSACSLRSQEIFQRSTLFVVSFSVRIISSIDLHRRLQMALISMTNWCFNDARKAFEMCSGRTDAPREEFKLIFSFLIVNIFAHYSDMCSACFLRLFALLSGSLKRKQIFAENFFLINLFSFLSRSVIRKDFSNMHAKHSSSFHTISPERFHLIHVLSKA